VVLFELEGSEDILKECVGLNAQGAEVLYTKRPEGQDGGAQRRWWVRVRRIGDDKARVASMGR
jgi:hypothetical protein